MRKLILAVVVIMFLPYFIYADDNSENRFKITYGGFIKSDFFYDTRQTVAAREGHFLLWPQRPEYDNENNDINNASSFNFLSIQTRLNFTVTAPEFFGFKTTGHVEGAFFGNSNPDINGFRLRHAFVKFDRNQSELMFGQYWNPMLLPFSFPDVVSFNTGCPFQPFSRNPQIRITQKVGNFSFVAAALSQRDFANVGPEGASSVYLRNAVMPDLHFQTQYNVKNTGGASQLMIGAGLAYKKILPELYSTVSITNPNNPDEIISEKYITDSGVEGLSYMYFARVAFTPVTIKMQYLLGQNLTDLLQIGGYGISKITDPTRGFVEYAPLRTQTYWADIHTNGDTYQFGLFLARSENLGATKDLVAGSTTTGFGNDIKILYRISPRFIINSGRARFAIECEYTGAHFGTVDTSINERGVPVNIEEVGNLRVVLGVYLFL
ncbi:MAG: hypothetical protein RG741_02715 [Bacteroidales bacterium]|nr:hypothetical protein [Bacteroidales bacterium]